MRHLALKSKENSWRKEMMWLSVNDTRLGLLADSIILGKFCWQETTEMVYLDAYIGN